MCESLGHRAALADCPTRITPPCKPRVSAHSFSVKTKAKIVERFKNQTAMVNHFGISRNYVIDYLRVREFNYDELTDDQYKALLASVRSKAARSSKAKSGLMQVEAMRKYNITKAKVEYYMRKIYKDRHWNMLSLEEIEYLVKVIKNANPN